MLNDSSNPHKPGDAPADTPVSTVSGSAAGGSPGDKGNTGKKANAAAVPWGPVAAVAYALIAFIGAQVIASALVVVYPYLRGWDTAAVNHWLDTSVVAQFWYVLCAEALTFGAIWWFIRKRGGRLSAIGWRRPRWVDPLYMLGGFVVYFFVYAIVVMLAKNLIPSLNLDQKQDLGFQSVSGNINLVLTFLSLVVLPPLVEETVFRGFVFTGLRTKLYPIWAAVCTSVLFAAVHLQFGSGKPLLWVAAIDTFVLSMVLCYLRQKTDSLWPGILLHGLKNGIAFAALYIFATH